MRVSLRAFVVVCFGFGIAYVAVDIAGAQSLDSVDQIRTLRLRGALTEARTLAEQELGVASRDPEQEVRLRLELARIHDRVGLHQNRRPVQAALEQIDAAARISEAAGPAAEAQVILARTEYQYRAEMKVREFPNASSLARSAVDQFRELGDKHGEAEAVHRLGLIHMQKRELDRAQSLFDESLKLDAEAGQRIFFQGEYERHVGFVHLMRGEAEAAIPYFERSLGYRRQAGAIDASLFAASTLASALVDLGRLEGARPHLLYATTVADRLDSPVGKARTTLVVGRLYESEGDLQAARLAYEETLRIAESVGYESVAARASEAIARISAIK